MGETVVIKSGPMIKRSQNKKKWSLVNYKNRWFELSRSFIIYYDNCEGGREVSFVFYFYYFFFFKFMASVLLRRRRYTFFFLFSVLSNLIFFIVSGVPFLLFLLLFTLALFFVYFFHSFHSLLTPISAFPVVVVFLFLSLE